MGLPEWVEDVFYTYLTSEFTSMDGDSPRTVAVMPFYDADRGSIIVTTTPAFYHKVKCIKRNPKVSLLYSNSNYSGLDRESVVLVQGEATVDEEDLDKNDRYVRDLMSRQRDSWKKIAIDKMVKELSSPIAKMMMDWYLIRVLIEVKPHRVFAWHDGNLEGMPEIFEVKPVEPE